MLQDDDIDAPLKRLNARATDVFDLFDFRFYEGPNPYLERSAFVFDLALTGQPKPTPIETYVAAVAKVYPHLTGATFPDHPALFARIASEAGKLDIGLRLDLFRVHSREHVSRIAVQSLDRRTQRRVVYFVWDWLESIAANEPFDYAGGMAKLQAQFNKSPYGGPTTYALLSTAEARGIPTTYLRDEGLMQYGYARWHVRGVSTTFSTDSQLDSDFTTRKDDCKEFLDRLGFPVPKGEVVTDLDTALAAAERIGFPVACKPLAGHKGIGVTANVHGPDELTTAFARAGGGTDGAEIIIETSLSGSDYRLLCANGRFVAGLERRRPWVEGDGSATIDQLIDRENATPGRADTPTSPMGKIIRDEAMLAVIEQQGYALDSVPPAGAEVVLRKVANLSAGGVSIDVTPNVHLDNVVLAQEVANNFRLTCMGIDVMAVDLSKSWKLGEFGIIEINAAPGVYMHVNPARGAGVDVPGAILDTWFGPGQPSRIPILAFNLLEPGAIKEIVEVVRARFPRWNVGAVCPGGVFVNRAERPKHPDYNTNVANLLRNPTIDLLIVAYDGDTLDADGMRHVGHDMVVLDDPTAVEACLARDLRPGGTLVTRTKRDVTIRRQGVVEQFTLDESEPFDRVFLREVAVRLDSLG